MEMMNTHTHADAQPHDADMNQRHQQDTRTDGVRLFQAAGQPPLSRPNLSAPHQHGSQEHGQQVHGNEGGRSHRARGPSTARGSRGTSTPVTSRMRSRSHDDIQTQSFLGRLQMCEQWIHKFDQGCGSDGVRAVK